MTDPDPQQAGEHGRRYRRRPVEVEVLRYEGRAWVPEHERHTAADFDPLRRFASAKFATVQVGTVTHGGPNQFGPCIYKRSDHIRIVPGDYIVKEPNGEISVWGAVVFAESFEEHSGRHNT